jgi:cytochrome c biogenesis protein ResB
VTGVRAVFDALSSRRTSILVMAFIALVGAVGAWIPQRSNITSLALEAWQAEHPALARIATALGLDAVFSTWWFLAVLGVFVLSLGIATTRMIADAAKRTRTREASGTTDIPGASFEDAVGRARALGYRGRADADGTAVLWRHRAGVWAPAVMHAGMVIALAAAAASSALTSRAVLDLSAGEVFEPGDAYLVTERGAFGGVPEIGAPLRLDGLETETWPTGELKTLTATLSVRDATGHWRAYRSTANDPLTILGHVVYVQAGEFGDAAYLVVTDPAGARYPVRMEFTFAGPGEVAYSGVAIGGAPAIDGRWDPDGVRSDRPLALRPAGDDDFEPVTLAEGDVASVGGHSVEFVASGQWARLIVARPYATRVLFAGFAVIALGSLMLYLWVPRRLVLVREGDGVRYAWWAPRMVQGYRIEIDEIAGRRREG